jgi:uncharacterized protein YbaR (Trm112 family)
MSVRRLNHQANTIDRAAGHPACPDARRLRQEGDFLIAETGGLAYPVDGIPVMLVEERAAAGVASLEVSAALSDQIPHWPKLENRCRRKGNRPAPSPDSTPRRHRPAVRVDQAFVGLGGRAGRVGVSDAAGL